jgi:hypothetical protein
MSNSAVLNQSLWFRCHLTNMSINKTEPICLTELVLKSQRKNMTRKLSLIHEQVEEAIGAGASYAEVINALKAQGFGDIPLETFRSALYRIRKRTKRNAPTAKKKDTAPRSQASPPLPSRVTETESNPQENTSPFEPLTAEQLGKMTFKDLLKRPEPKF